MVESYQILPLKLAINAVKSTIVVNLVTNKTVPNIRLNLVVMSHLLGTSDYQLGADFFKGPGKVFDDYFH